MLFDEQESLEIKMADVGLHPLLPRAQVFGLQKIDNVSSVKFVDSKEWLYQTRSFLNVLHRSTLNPGLLHVMLDPLKQTLRLAFWRAALKFKYQSCLYIFPGREPEQMKISDGNILQGSIFRKIEIDQTNNNGDSFVLFFEKWGIGSLKTDCNQANSTLILILQICEEVGLIEKP